MRIDALQVGDEVEVQRRRLDALQRIAGEAAQVRIGICAFEVAEQHLLRQQFLRALQVAVQEHAHAEAEVRDEARVQVADLGHAGVGEIAVLGDLLVLDVGQHALDDVADLLEVDRERHDVGPAAALALVQRLARDLRQVELHRRVEVVDDVVLLAQALGQRAVVGLQHGEHAGQHVLDDVADADRLARRIGDGQRRGVERGRIEVARLGGIVGQRLRRQQPFGDARDLLGPEDEQQRERHVEEEVEQHHLARGIELEAGDPAVDVAAAAGSPARSRSA